MADEIKKEEENPENLPATSSSSEVKNTRDEDQKNDRSTGKSKRSDDESNSDETNKRQKLDENSSDGSDSEESSSFRKLNKKIQKRHYRRKSDQDEQSGERTEEPPKSEDRTNPPAEDPATATTEDEENSEHNESDRTTEEDRDSDSGSNKSSTSSHSSVPLLDVPKPRWFAVNELVKRQMGTSNIAFQDKFYGSVNAVQRLERMTKLKGHSGCVNALNFNHSGNLLASSSDDLKLIVWDWSRRKIVTTMHTGHRSNVCKVKWMHLEPENLLLTSGRDGEVRLINLTTESNLKLSRHLSASTFATHIDLPHTVLTSGRDSKVLLIDIRNRKTETIMSVRDGRNVLVNSINFHPYNKNEICVAGQSSKVLIYDMRKPSVAVRKMHPEHMYGNWLPNVTDARYNHNGTEVVASYSNEHVYLFNNFKKTNDNRTYARRYFGHRNFATDKCVSFFGPNSEFVMSGSDCGNIFIWDKKSEAIVQWVHGDDQGVVNQLEPHPSFPLMATSGLDHDVKIWLPTCAERVRNDQFLKVCMRNNFAQSELEHIPGINGEVLWLLLQQTSFRVFGLSMRNMRPITEEFESPEEYESSDDDSSSDDESTHSNSNPECRPS